MRFRILGQLEVNGVGHLEPREARTLAVLLLTPNRLVTRQRLMEGIWDEALPATASRQLLNCVSRLRRMLGPDGIQSSDAGYRIEVARGELDADVFAGLVESAAAQLEAGDSAGAVRRLRRALALWHGPALAGLTGRIVEAGAARLDEQRVDAMEQCLELEMEHDPDDAVIGELTELVNAHPLRERPVGLLMRALSRSGRRAEALAAYRELAGRLADELGIDPGSELEDLYTAILRGEGRTTGAAVAVPRQLPPAVRCFVGREAELKELTELLDDVGGDGLVIAIVDGTPGIGKTALALHWAYRAAPSFPDGQLYADLRGFGPLGRPTTPAEAVRGFLDALGVPSEKIPAGLEAQVALYRTLVADRRMLVVLDNARDADQVRPLLPGTPASLALVTSRNRLTGLVATGGARSLALELLSEAEARDLLVQRLGAQRVAREPRAAMALIGACARLPLALVIVAGRAAAHPHLSLSTLSNELAAARLDALEAGDDANAQMRAVFSWSYRHLRPPVARLFRLLGLHPGPSLSMAAAASLAGADPRRGMRELVQTNLVFEPRPGRFALHDLLREYAAELADGSGAALRRLLDYYLGTAYQADRMLDPKRDPLDGAPPETGAFAGPREALEWFSEEHPVLLNTVELAHREGHDRHAWQLAWSLSTYFGRQGHWHDMLTAQRTALAATVRLGDRAAQARTHNGLGMAHSDLADFASARREFGSAARLFAELGDHIGQARVAMNLCWVLEREEHYAEALAEAQRAHRHYHLAGHAAGQADALNNIGWYHGLLGRHDETVHWCRRALAVQRRIGNLTGQADALDSIGYAYDKLGEHGRACHRYRWALSLYRRAGDRNAEADVLTHLAESLLSDGLAAAARRTYRRALQVLQDLDHPRADSVRTRLAELSALPA